MSPIHDNENPSLKHLMRRSAASWPGHDNKSNSNINVNSTMTTSPDSSPLVPQSSPLKKSASFSIWESQPASRPPTKSSMCRRLKSLFRRSSTPDTTSLDLWNAAYDSLRDNEETAALVAAYEVIITHQLPDRLKLSGAMSTSFRRLCCEERSRLMTIITENGLRKHRSSSSSTSHTDVPVRGLLKTSKHDIESLLREYPSAAVAWAGISTLTPLLLQAVLDCLRGARGGVVYLLARIPWYTHIAELLESSSWKCEQDFKFHRDNMRDSIVYLYTKVLELEMNCVCGAASNWCIVARTVTNWNKLATVINSLQDADRQIVRTIEMYAADETRERLLDDNEILEYSNPGCWPDQEAAEKESELDKA